LHICDSFKEQLIVIAEKNPETKKNLEEFFLGQGFIDIKFAPDGNKLYETIKPYHHQPEQIGLVIINEDLPQCQLGEICTSLACGDNKFIPVIILRNDRSTHTKNNIFFNGKCLVYDMALPVRASELLIAVNFLLTMKHERFLRYVQEQRVVSNFNERKVIEAKLKFLATHDELTGLLNRNSFEQHLRLRLNSNNEFPLGALLFIDIDRFSLINELEGFEIGDRLILEVVPIIKKLIDEDVHFARIGSDEFCLLLDNRSEFVAKDTAEKIRKVLDNFHFMTGTACYSISVSIGIASLKMSKLATHPGDLISRAHRACQIAKECGRNMVYEYCEQDKLIKERHHDVYWVPLIREALKINSFCLDYQPVVKLSDGSITHYEVLIRMRGKNGEIISPDNFIPVAERMGLIHGIDLWVVENAIDFLASLADDKSHICLSINLSGIAFQDLSLLPTIKHKLQSTQVAAERITFEITETAVVDNFEQTRKMIANIRALGCHFSLDDFGAGFCSFNYLKKFPVDYIKIDGQFIQNLNNDETDQVLVRSMIEIAKKLGKKTIAEYVECPKVVVRLQEMGVDYGQGFLFGKPRNELLTENMISIQQLVTDYGKSILQIEEIALH
jgi:diguanylate cyclase (GGDEF)-like protein